MLRQSWTTVLLAATFILALILTGQPAQADWSISFRGEFGSPYYNYGNRVSSEYRRGYQVDDWIERGASSVTESPIFADGIRLTAWSTQYEDDYDYALASAIYFFEIPYNARSIKVKISYDGEADRAHFGDAIAGRVWIRRAHIGDDYVEYYPTEGRYEDVDQPLYGDTFVLRARKSSETIRLSAGDYTIDGVMELHVVAEGSQRIDVKRIEVETYTSSPPVRVATRYYKDYVWHPWYDYTYWYFYTGPVYHFGDYDYYYVRYTYPSYRHHYVEIRRRYNSYLRVYYVKRPKRRVSWTSVVRVPKGTQRTWDRDRLSRWTSDHEEVRRSYRITSMKTRRSVEVQRARTQVRSVLTTYSRPSPAAARSSSGRITVETSKTRRETSISPSVRTRSSTDISRSTERSPTRVETQSSTKVRRGSTTPPVRTRSSPPSSSERERSVKQAPTRSTPQRSRGTTPDAGQVKTRRESTRTQTPERRESSSVRKAPSRTEKPKQSPPAKRKVEVKQNDDDDDDDEKKSRSSSSSSGSSSSSSGSSSPKRKRVR